MLVQYFRWPGEGIVIVLGFWIVFASIDLIDQVCSFDFGVCSAGSLGVGIFVELMACHHQNYVLLNGGFELVMGILLFDLDSAQIGQSVKFYHVHF